MWQCHTYSLPPVRGLLGTETPRLRADRAVHVHAFGNTHYWLDPKNAWPITASIVAALAGLSPADRAAFEARREAFLSRLTGVAMFPKG